MIVVSVWLVAMKLHWQALLICLEYLSVHMHGLAISVNADTEIRARERE